MWSSTAVIGRHRWLQELPYDVSTVWIPPGHTPWHPTIVGALTAVLSMACSGPSTLPADGTVDNSADVRHDLHSYSNPSQARVRHLDLELEVSFDERILRGTATLTVERVQPDADTIILDTRDLTIRRVETSAPNDDAWPATFHQGSSDPVLGTPLTVFLPPGTTQVAIRYETSPDASGLQWLVSSQTTGKQHPFMFTQSQAIHARSWIPLQDSPGVRLTYSARVRTPSDLRAVMSAANDPETPTTGDYRFDMTQSIPSYLIALAVGDLAFESLGTRVGVYAEPAVLSAAAREFEDTEAMIEATERLYGPYRWERYDLLVLPPSFPFGGMENPRLTFVTPTILAGDKSLVSLVAHELAHSWSGNLVTNATWRDFWLNEGFTTYLERRILEQVYGRDREEMEAVLGRRALREELDRLDDPDEILHVDLSGRDPDDGMTLIPYEKGALFLRHLEEAVGRHRFDEFLRGYFEAFAFQSITTDDFLDYMGKHLLTNGKDRLAEVPIGAWVREPGLPASAPEASSGAFAVVEQQAEGWLAGEVPVDALETAAWTTHEWLHFVGVLPVRLSHARLRELDAAFGLTSSGNSEIAHVWLLLTTRSGYEPVKDRLREYLVSIGRRKLVRPLYEALAETPEGRTRALDIYGEARPTYHPITVDTIDQILGWDG